MYQDSREDYFARQEERREEIRDRWRLTAGAAEFLAVVAGVAAIFVLVLLIVSLLNWLWQDLGSVFDVVFSMFR